MKWTNINDRKPKKGRAVLVCQAFGWRGGKMGPGQKIAIGCRIDPIQTSAEKYEFVCACNHSVLWRVSHWMPLPALPPNPTSLPRSAGGIDHE